MPHTVPASDPAVQCHHAQEDTELCKECPRQARYLYTIAVLAGFPPERNRGHEHSCNQSTCQITHVCSYTHVECTYIATTCPVRQHCILANIHTIVMLWGVRGDECVCVHSTCRCIQAHVPCVYKLNTCTCSHLLL